MRESTTCRESLSSGNTASSFTATNGTSLRHERKLAKFWLDPVELATSKRFAAHELREIITIVLDRSEQFIEAWNEHFGS
jgi:hypothetical protein